MKDEQSTKKRRKAAAARDPRYLLTQEDETYIETAHCALSDAIAMTITDSDDKRGEISRNEARRILRLMQTTDGKEYAAAAIIKRINTILTPPFFTITKTEGGDFAIIVTDKDGNTTENTMQSGSQEADVLNAAPLDEIDNVARGMLELQGVPYIPVTLLSPARRTLRYVSDLLNTIEPQSGKKDLPVLDEIRPKVALLPHTKVFTSLTKPEPWQNWEQMALAGFEVQDTRKKQGKASTYLSLEFLSDGNSGFSCDRKLSRYSLSALRAALSFYEAGNETFTPRQLVAQIKGLNPDNAGIKEATIRAAERELDRDRVSLIKIDASRTFEKWGITTHTGYFESYLLPLEKIFVQAKGAGKKPGDTMTAYRFIKTPAILEHARALDQLYRVPVELLQTGEISATDDVVVLRDYLLERIYAAKDERLSRTILYSALYDLLEAAEPSPYGITEKEYKSALTQYRKKTATIRRNTKGLFDNWKKQGLLKGYSERKKGKAYDAITIIL